MRRREKEENRRQSEQQTMSTLRKALGLKNPVAAKKEKKGQEAKAMGAGDKGARGRGTSKGGHGGMDKEKG